MLKIYSYDLFRKGLILETPDGLGEVAPLPGFSRETLEEATEELLSGKAPTLPSVRFGLACAQVSFPKSPIPCLVAGLNRPPKSSPFAAYKLKAKKPRETVSMCHPYRGTRLRLDCNQKWNFDEAIEFCRHFPPSFFEYLEEPIDDPSKLVELARRTGYQIAQDESLLTHGLFRGLIPVVKPTLHGGLLSAPHQVLSSAHESGVGLVHIARLATTRWPKTPIGLDTAQFQTQSILPLWYEGGALHFGSLQTHLLKRIL